MRDNKDYRHGKHEVRFSAQKPRYRDMPRPRYSY